MSIEDYIQKQRDITYLKLTREIQEVKQKLAGFFKNQLIFIFGIKYLDTPDYDAKKQKEIAVLEQTLAYKKKVNL